MKVDLICWFPRPNDLTMEEQALENTMSTLELRAVPQVGDGFAVQMDHLNPQLQTTIRKLIPGYRDLDRKTVKFKIERVEHLYSDSDHYIGLFAEVSAPRT